MNTPVREGETIEGSRTMRNRPYPVLKCSKDERRPRPKQSSERPLRENPGPSATRGSDDSNVLMSRRTSQSREGDTSAHAPPPQQRVFLSTRPGTLYAPAAARFQRVAR